jgi:protein xylosyltransferase
VRPFPSQRFFINLSAQDYPLCRASELVALTQGIPADANFIDVNYISHAGIIFHRVTHVVLDEALYRVAPSNTPNFRTNYTSQLRRHYPNRFTPYHGEAWNMLSASFARYIATSSDGLPRRIFSFYANTPSSPEGFFQSLLCASRFADTLVNDDLRYVDWSNPTLQHPPPISARHLEKLKSVGAVFARKFRSATITTLVRKQLLRLDPPGEFGSSITLDAIRARIQSSMATNRTCATGVRKTGQTERHMSLARRWQPPKI